MEKTPTGSLYEHNHPDIEDFDNAEEHYKDFIENASDIVYRTDRAGNFVYVNPVAAHIMEYPVDELLKMNYLDLVTEEHRKETEEFYLNQITENIETTYFEFETETKSGKRVWFGQNVRIIKRDNKWIGFQALARDITDRHSARQRLKNNQEQLRLFVKNAPVSVAMFDTEMNYIMASDRWVHHYDIGHDSVTDLNHFELFPNLSEQWRENFRMGLSGRSQSASEERTVDNQGVAEWIKWEIHPWHKSDGAVGGIIVYIEDITKRKKDEMALVQAREEAQQASAAKSRFIASMSHEFRTPLNAVMGFAEILEGEASLTDSQKELVRHIHNSGSHLLSMINDVIEISRIETSRIEYEEVDFAIQSLLSSSAKPFADRFSQKGLQFTAHIGSGVPEYISADLEVLQQVLRQLISNALKFTDRGKVTIEVEFEDMDTDAAGRDGRLRLRVADTGIGFDEEKKERIFRPFTKLHERGYTGTGLGLTLVNRFCRYLGGELEASSTPGKGSAFELSIAVRKRSDGEINTEKIDFINHQNRSNRAVIAADVGAFINSLPSDKRGALIQAMELQELDHMVDLVLSLKQSEGHHGASRLVKAAQQYNFAFLKEVLEASRS